MDFSDSVKLVYTIYVGVEEVAEYRLKINKRHDFEKYREPKSLEDYVVKHFKELRPQYAERPVTAYFKCSEHIQI